MFYQYANAPAGWTYPEADGTPPDEWAGPYELWWASGVEVPARQAAMQAHVVGAFVTNGAAAVGSLPKSTGLPADAWIHTQCPAGDNVAPDGACSVPPPCHVGQPCQPPQHCPQGTQGDGITGTCCPPSEEPGPNDVGCQPIPPGDLSANPCTNGTYTWKYGQPNPECVGAVLVK